MSLLDHFHPPVSERRGWEGFHGLWAAALVEKLNRDVLADEYFADMQVHIGSQVEVDVATIKEPRGPGGTRGGATATDTAAASAWTPPATTLVVPTVFPASCSAERRRGAGRSGGMVSCSLPAQPP